MGQPGRPPRKYEHRYEEAASLKSLAMLVNKLVDEGWERDEGFSALNNQWYIQPMRRVKGGGEKEDAG